MNIQTTPEHTPPYLVRLDADSILFAPDTGHSTGDWPIFHLTAEQADALASTLRRAAAAQRWKHATVFTVSEQAGANEIPLFHLALPATDMLTAPALCGHKPATRLSGRSTWTTVHPLDAIDKHDPHLCRTCLARWEASHS